MRGGRRDGGGVAEAIRRTRADVPAIDDEAQLAGDRGEVRAGLGFAEEILGELPRVIAVGERPLIKAIPEFVAVFEVEGREDIGPRRGLALCVAFRGPRLHRRRIDQRIVRRGEVLDERRPFALSEKGADDQPGRRAAVAAHLQRGGQLVGIVGNVAPVLAGPVLLDDRLRIRPVLERNAPEFRIHPGPEAQHARLVIRQRLHRLRAQGEGRIGRRIVVGVLVDQHIVEPEGAGPVEREDDGGELLCRRDRRRGEGEGLFLPRRAHGPRMRDGAVLLRHREAHRPAGDAGLLHPRVDTIRPARLEIGVETAAASSAAASRS
jgi:hypothetical protein